MEESEYHCLNFRVFCMDEYCDGENKRDDDLWLTAGILFVEDIDSVGGAGTVAHVLHVHTVVTDRQTDEHTERLP